MPDYKDKPVNFISVNTRDPRGKVNAEVKRYKIKIPIYYGRGQGINKAFKVAKMPRLILIKEDGTVYKDVVFMKAEQLRAELDGMLAEISTDTDSTETETSE